VLTIRAMAAHLDWEPVPHPPLSHAASHFCTPKKPGTFDPTRCSIRTGELHSRHPVRGSPPFVVNAVLEFLNCNRICLNRF
jgi:hypothetical protein